MLCCFLALSMEHTYTDSVLIILMIAYKVYKFNLPYLKAKMHE